MFDDHREEFGDKQMDKLFVLNSESDWRAVLVTFAKTKVTAVQGSRRPLKKKQKKILKPVQDDKRKK